MRIIISACGYFTILINRQTQRLCIAPFPKHYRTRASCRATSCLKPSTASRFPHRRRPLRQGRADRRVQFARPAAAGQSVFRCLSQDPRPVARELVQQLVGTAYACATLNADLVAATRLRLYVRTRPGEPKAKAYLAPLRVSRKTLTRLKEDPAVAALRGRRRDRRGSDASSAARSAQAAQPRSGSAGACADTTCAG